MTNNFIAEPIVIGLDNEINNNVEIWKDVVGYEGLYEYFSDVFPNDPARGCFSLLGLKDYSPIK